MSIGGTDLRAEPGCDRDSSPVADAAEDERWMRRALELAERGRGTASPNPLVGCVLMRGGRVVGEGWHARAGGPHAEVAALAHAGPTAAGATAYVTLEPCDHTGRTPPCTRALLDAEVTRVVVALAEEHSVAAGGAARLRAAGLPVTVGLLVGEAKEQNRVFLHGLATGRPWVVLKAAMSLDGRTAAADGTSQWLTGPATRARGHRLRAEADAVLAGSGTILADDSLLTVRLDGWQGDQPLRVVLDGRGRVPAEARVLDDAAPTLLITRAGTGVPDGVDVARVATGPDGSLDPHAVLAELWDRQVRSVLVEGGATVAGALVRAGLVDELVCHVAPVLLGEAGIPFLAGPGPGTLADAPRLRTVAVERVGDDAVITLRPVRRGRFPDAPREES